MTKMTKIAVSALLGLAVLSTTASADVKKGQKLYMKKMKASCGFSGAKFAAKHTQDEWDEIGVDGMAKEIKKLCPKVKDKALKSKYLKDYFDFAHDFASDSGNVPSC